MSDNFGLKIGVEGEREFKKSLSEINQTFKVLGSEMKLVTSQLPTILHEEAGSVSFDRCCALIA